MNKKLAQMVEQSVLETLTKIALKEIHQICARNPRNKIASVAGSKTRVDLAEKIAKKWIQDAIKEPGRVREYLGVPEGKNIPMEKLDAAIENLKGKGDKSLLSALLLAKRLKEMKKGATVLTRKFAKPWSKLPKGWTEESLESFWESLTSRAPKHKVTQCIKRMEDKMDDPGAFCASLADKVIPGWREEAAKDKKASNEPTELINLIKRIPGVKTVTVVDTWPGNWFKLEIKLQSEIIPLKLHKNRGYADAYKIKDIRSIVAKLRSLLKNASITIDSFSGPKLQYEYQDPIDKARREKRESGYDSDKIFVAFYLNDTMGKTSSEKLTSSVKRLVRTLEEAIQELQHEAKMVELQPLVKPQAIGNIVDALHMIESALKVFRMTPK